MTFNGLEISELSAELGGKVSNRSTSVCKGNVLGVLGLADAAKHSFKVIAGIVTPTDGQIFGTQ